MSLLEYSFNLKSVRNQFSYENFQTGHDNKWKIISAKWPLLVFLFLFIEIFNLLFPREMGECDVHLAGHFRFQIFSEKILIFQISQSWWSVYSIFLSERINAIWKFSSVISIAVSIRKSSYEEFSSNLHMKMSKFSHSILFGKTCFIL